MNSELERRIRLDFTKRKTDLLPYIQTYFPDVSATQFKQWEDALIWRKFPNLCQK